MSKQTIVIKETQPIAIHNDVSGVSFTPSVEYSDGWDNVSLTITLFHPTPMFSLKLPPLDRVDTVIMEAHYSGDKPPMEVTLTHEKLDGTTIDISGLKLFRAMRLQEDCLLLTYKAESGQYTITDR